MEQATAPAPARSADSMVRDAIAADLDNLLIGLSCPVVLIDLGQQPATGLHDLMCVLERAPDARILVLNPEFHDEAAGLARRTGRHARGVGLRVPIIRGQPAGSLDRAGPAQHGSRRLVPSLLGERLDRALGMAG